jgi:hypothetical protein
VQLFVLFVEKVGEGVPPIPHFSTTPDVVVGERTSSRCHGIRELVHALECSAARAVRAGVLPNELNRASHRRKCKAGIAVENKIIFAVDRKHFFAASWRKTSCSRSYRFGQMIVPQTDRHFREQTSCG